MTAVRRAGTAVLLFFGYLLLVVPVGLVVRLLRDPLRRRPDRSARSYWTDLRPGAGA